MSIFERPDSPPPRAPSPEAQPAPLPSPHLRARLRPSSSQQSMTSSHSHNLSPRTPPGLSPFPSHNNKPRSILSQRSFDHIKEHRLSSTSRDFSGASTKHPRPRTRSTNALTPPSTPRFLQVPSSTSPRSAEFPQRRRSRSPPPSPNLSSPPPPVPPIPAFVLDAIAEKKTSSPPKPLPVVPIQLPELENLPPLSEEKPLGRKASLPSLDMDKGKSKGMTCLKFFTLRNSKQRPQTADR